MENTMKGRHLYIPLLFLTMISTTMANDLQGYLSEGQFDQGITAYKKITTPTNADRFALGTLQFFKAIETLTQDLYRYGLNSKLGRRANLPFLRLPIPMNPNPEMATPAAIHGIFERFQHNLEAANSSLEGLDATQFHQPIDIAAIRLDINANGKLEEEEHFHQIYSFYNRRARSLFKDNKPLVIDFDLADAHWLRGYSHLLLALTDTIRAYRWESVYEQSAHVFFAITDSRVGTILKQQGPNTFGDWADMIAGLHAMSLPLAEPERLKSAHQHLLATVAASRQTWDIIEAESDNQNEWIPGPKQTGIAGARIGQRMVSGWHQFLDEFEAILLGKKLIPHWRIRDGRGINLKKVFVEPTAFDPIYWAQGSAAIPYLEKGELTQGNTWRQILRTFEGNFIGFAIWVN
jgi:hypothetical protein